MKCFYSFLKFSSVCLLATFISGCTHRLGAAETENFGNYLQVKPDTSTKTNIYNIFGQPHDVVNKDNGTVWTYYFVKQNINWTTFVPFLGMVTGGTDNEVRVTQFYFNSENIFEKTDSKTKDQYVNNLVGISKMVTSHDEYERVKTEMEKLNLQYDKAALDKIKYII